MRRTFFALALLALPMGGISMETAASDLVIVRESDVITEDLFAAGERVIVRGVIQGDLIAASFNDVTIEGEIQGDVMAVAPEVIITGEVHGSVRVLAGSLQTEGEIRDDVAVAAISSSLGGEVGRDALGFGWAVDVPGSIGRELRAQMYARVAVPGSVGADAEVNGGDLDISGDVGGDLRYRGDLELSDSAVVDGLVTELGDLPIPIRVRALLFGARILVLSSLAGLAALAAWAAPRATSAAVEQARRPWMGLFVGVAAVLIPPLVIVGILAAFGAVSADLTVVAVLAVAPLAAAYLAAVVLGLAAGLVPAAAIVTSWMGKRTGVARYLIGALLLAFLTFIPTIGPLVVAVVWVAGLGSVALAARMRS